MNHLEKMYPGNGSGVTSSQQSNLDANKNKDGSLMNDMKKWRPDDPPTSNVVTSIRHSWPYNWNFACLWDKLLSVDHVQLCTYCKRARAYSRECIRISVEVGWLELLQIISTNSDFQIRIYGDKKIRSVFYSTLFFSQSLALKISSR